MCGLNSSGVSSKGVAVSPMYKIITAQALYFVSQPTFFPLVVNLWG